MNLFFVFFIIALIGYLENLCRHYQPSLSLSHWLFLHRSKTALLPSPPDWQLSHPTKFCYYSCRNYWLFIILLFSYLLIADVKFFILYLVLTCSLYLLAILDWFYGLLPNVLVFFLMFFGVIASPILCGNIIQSFIGILVGFITLFVLNALYRLRHSCSGMGQGDIKFFAALGAWIGWEKLPSILLLACVGGLVFAIAKFGTLRTADLKRSLPFGTFLALAGWVWISVEFIFYIKVP